MIIGIALAFVFGGSERVVMMTAASVPLFRPRQRIPLIPHLLEVIAAQGTHCCWTFVIARFVVPRFEATYAERTAAIQGGLEKAEQAQEAAEAACVSTTSSWRRLAPKRPGFARTRNLRARRSSPNFASRRRPRSPGSGPRRGSAGSRACHSHESDAG